MGSEGIKVGIKVAMVASMLLIGLGQPAQAYYPDDHIWDREYQSGNEWWYPNHKKPVPWISSTAWRQRYPTAPAWWSTYAYSAWAPGTNNMAWYDWRYDQSNYAKATWTGAYAAPSAYAYPSAYVPASTAWTNYQRTGGWNAWDDVSWNVNWWDGSYAPMNNRAYYSQVFNSATNPFSNTALNRELQVSAAYGDLARVKSLVGMGADIHAKDWEGYTALTWAAQHGRSNVVDYLLGRYAMPNTVDRWGYTPLMWALQQGHTDIAAMLLAKGGNPRVSTMYGVTPEVLATYAAGGRSRGLIADALAGRRIAYGSYYKAGGNWGNTPQTTYQQGWMPQQGYGDVTVPMNQQPQQQAQPQQPTNTGGARPATMSQAEGIVKLAALGADFGTDYKSFLAEQTSGGLSLNSLNAVVGTDADVGRNLATMFTKVVKDRDLRQARQDLEVAKASVKGNTRFQKYVTNVDATLVAMGF